MKREVNKMARIYDVVCKSCGAKWAWCKYDAPDEQCPVCGELLTQTVKDCNEDRMVTDWDEGKVIVFGVGSTNLDVEQAVEKIKSERRLE